MNKKTLCAAVVLSMMLMVPSFAEDEEEPAPPFYAQVGVSWAIKTTSEVAGNQSESKISYEVVSLDEKANVAKVKMQSVSMVGGNEYKGPEQEITMPLTATAQGKGGTTTKGAGGEVETKEETVKVPAGEFDCVVTKSTAGGNTSTVWMSKEHNGLMVKQVSETAGTKSTTELVALSMPE